MVTFILFFLLGYFLTKKAGSSGCCLSGCLLSLVGLALIFFPLLLYFITDETWIRVAGLLVWCAVYRRYWLLISLFAIVGFGIGFFFDGALLGAIIGACIALMFSIKDE